MACRTERLKQRQADVLVRCQQIRVSRTQTDASKAASAHLEAAHALGLVRTALKKHTNQTERNLKERYASLRDATVDIQSLLSVRAYEQEAACEMELHMAQLEQVKHGAETAVELLTAAEQEQLACARRMAKLEELRREVNTRAKVANIRIERSKEDGLPMRRSQW